MSIHEVQENYRRIDHYNLKVHETGFTVVDLARHHGVAENTIFRWKSKYGGMEVSDAKRLRALEAENNKLIYLKAVRKSDPRWQDYMDDILINLPK